MNYNSIQALLKDYQSKKTTPLEVTKSYVEKIKNSKTNAFLSVFEKSAIDQAKALEEEWKSLGDQIFSKKPLFGVPVGIKDNLTLDGEKTTCASKMLENYVSPYTATCVQNLLDAGAVIVGKCNLDEFAMGGSNENSAFGPVLHPTHPDRVPGGSSGGSVAAVAEGLCLASLGSDTGGSIRLPSSFCGTYGFKPTYGRVSRFGLVAFASSLDQVGPITNNLEDLELVTKVISSFDEKDSTSLPLPVRKPKKDLSSLQVQNAKIGYSQKWLSDPNLQSDVKKAYEATMESLKKKGATFVDVSLPHLDYSVAVYYVVAVCEASSNLSRYDGVRYGTRSKKTLQGTTLKDFYKSNRSLFGSEVKRRIMLGTFALSSGYYDAYYKRASQVRRMIKLDYDKAFESVDFILGPVSPSTAFKLGEKSKNPLQMYLMDLFTIPANLAGVPAISVPVGKDQEGLPIGMQLVADQNQDEALLKFSKEIV